MAWGHVISYHANNSQCHVVRAYSPACNNHDSLMHTAPVHNVTDHSAHMYPWLQTVGCSCVNLLAVPWGGRTRLTFWPVGHKLKVSAAALVKILNTHSLDDFWIQHHWFSGKGGTFTAWALKGYFYQLEHSRVSVQWWRDPYISADYKKSPRECLKLISPPVKL